MRRIHWLATVALVWASAASAAPTIVQNVDEPTRKPYQQFGTAACTLNGDCAIVFPAMTAVETLVLHAACSFALATGGAVGFASIGSQTVNGNNVLPSFAFGTSDGLTEYGINAETYLFYAKAVQPRIDVVGNGAAVQNLACTLSGYSQ